MFKKHFEIGKRNLKSENHWEILTEYRITKPTIICLGGNGTISSREANNVCKIAEGLIGLKAQEGKEEATYDSVDVIGVVYGLEVSEIADRFGLNSFRAGKLSDDDIDEIINEMLLPLCFDDEGNLLDIDSACKNMSLITFFTYCYGATALFEIMYFFNKKLVNLGYSKEEVRKLLSCTAQVTFAPYTSAIFVPTIEIVSREDLSIGNYYDDMKCFVEGVNLVYQKEYTHMRGKSPSRHFDSLGIYSSKLLNNSRDVENEHVVTLIARDCNWASLYFDKNNDIVSQMVGYSLARFVANSIENANSDKKVDKISFVELLEELEDIKRKYTNEELKVRK